MKIVLALFFTLGSIYLLLPSKGLPPFPPGVRISIEPADTESPYRKSFYSNLSRSQLMQYYTNQFGRHFQIRLNHPPEEAQMLIRDQARSSWLEELVHPLKDSLYINGFFPTKPTEQINVKGVHYDNYVTVRYVPSHPIARVTVFALAVLCIYMLYIEYVKK